MLLLGNNKGIHWGYIGLMEKKMDSYYIILEYILVLYYSIYPDSEKRPNEFGVSCLRPQIV